jgi:hypothetical protein
MTAVSTHRPLRRAVLALALALAVGAQAKAPTVAADPTEQDEVGALIGDLMFHADLLSRLDAICPPPAAASARDWQAVVRTLPPDARTPQLRALSRRLSDDAARSMVQASGGCGTRHYAQVYTETRLDYETLLAQWARLSA